MSSPSKEKAVPLFQMPLGQDIDVVLSRNRARFVAEALRFDKQLQVKIATAVSEIARNAFRYAREARVSFYLYNPPDLSSPQALIVSITDSGPGIPHLSEVLAGTYRSKTGLGSGIRGAKRLMDRVDIQSTPAGTVVDLWQNLPKGKSVSGEEIGKIATEFGVTLPPNPLEELTTQNQELVETLEQVSAQGIALEQVNEELRETNRGVVALYDELDTVHQLGRVVASKLDLDSLLQAITDATTELSNAEFGAFLLLLPKTENLSWQCISGPLMAELPKTPPPALRDLILDDSSDIFRFEGENCPALLRQTIGLRTAIVCPLRDEQRALLGAILLGHAGENVFTERTERILPTVALQATMGIANARLYRHVQSANQAKAQFLAVLSHELRTPLNPVFAILTALEENPALPEDARSDLVIMRRNLQLEAILIDDLLDLTRITEGKLTLKLATQDLHAVAHSVIHTCGEEINRKQIRISLDLSAAEHHVQGDDVRLQQTLWNLLNNAVKFTPEGGSVAIATVNHTAGQVTLSVTDSGRGIEPTALSRVFAAFEQEDSLIAASFGGLGLGLAISKGIMEAHHGTIKAESEGLNQGARFSISLPTVAYTPSESQTLQPVAASPAPENLRILLIDDHADTRMIMSRMLASRGYIMSEAGTVAEALAIYTAQDFDLVVSDLGLPDGSGHDLMIAMLKIKPVKSIALSGYGMESDIAKSKAAGFALHFTKPVDFPALEDAIAELGQVPPGSE